MLYKVLEDIRTPGHSGKVGRGLSNFTGSEYILSISNKLLNLVEIAFSSCYIKWSRYRPIIAVPFSHCLRVR